MAFELDPTLNPALMGLAWMVGSWRGNGHGSWPDQGEFTYGQQLDIVHNGGDFLHYHSQLYTVDEDNQPLEPLLMETGYWRPQADGSLEVVMCSPEGWSEVWVGKIEGAKIELVTDAVVRTQHAEVEYTGGQRLYGNVEGGLLWTFDRATTTQKLQPYLWAKLERA